jgi:hypothetical protein
MAETEKTKFGHRLDIGLHMPPHKFPHSNLHQ